jgi:hypothetical protein
METLAVKCRDKCQGDSMCHWRERERRGHHDRGGRAGVTVYASKHYDWL